MPSAVVGAFLAKQSAETRATAAFYNHGKRREASYKVETASGAGGGGVDVGGGPEHVARHAATGGLDEAGVGRGSHEGACGSKHQIRALDGRGRIGSKRLIGASMEEDETDPSIKSELWER